MEIKESDNYLNNSYFDTGNEILCHYQVMINQKSLQPIGFTNTHDATGGC